MPKERPETHRARSVRYMKEHVITKRVPFNDRNLEDVRLLEYLQGVPNFSRYVKDLIRADMDRTENLLQNR